MQSILVVEDGEPIRNLLKVRLEKDGYEVKGVGKIGEALHQVRTNMPDVIVLDLTFDDENPFVGLVEGMSFLAMLRRQYRDARTAVIIFSSNPSPQAEAKAKSMGVRAVIDKKDGVGPLLEAIQAVFSERKEAALAAGSSADAAKF